MKKKCFGLLNVKNTSRNIKLFMVNMLTLNSSNTRLQAKPISQTVKRFSNVSLEKGLHTYHLGSGRLRMSAATLLLIILHSLNKMSSMIYLA